MEIHFLHMCASPQFHKFKSLIYFNAHAEYGSEIWEDSDKPICKPDMIHISQESAHNTGLLEQYIQHL